MKWISKTYCQKFYRNTGFISTNEAAKLYNYHPRTIRHWYEKGKLKGFKQAKKIWLDPQSLKDYVFAQQKTQKL